MDSLMSVELRSRLERVAGRPLPSTLTFNYPNVGALAGFLESHLFPDAPEAPADAGEVEPTQDGTDGLSDEELMARLVAQIDRLK
jgi:hypothetical protein